MKLKCFWQLNCVLMLNWIVWNRTDYLHKKWIWSLNNLQSLICHKTEPLNQPICPCAIKDISFIFFLKKEGAIKNTGPGQHFASVHPCSRSQSGSGSNGNKAYPTLPWSPWSSLPWDGLVSYLEHSLVGMSYPPLHLAYS